jgi:hypothetical protein
MGSVASVEKPLTSPGSLRRRGWAAPLAVGAGIVVLAAMNFWADRLFARWDLTSDRRYSLSPSTRDLLASLPDTVRVRFYLTPGLPQPYETHGRFVRDLLAEYQRAAPRAMGHRNRSLPTGSDDMDREFRRLHMPPARFTQVASDQYQVREGHMGLVLRYNDKEEVLPFVKNVGHPGIRFVQPCPKFDSTRQKKTFSSFPTTTKYRPTTSKRGPRAGCLTNSMWSPLGCQRKTPACVPTRSFC